MKLLKIFAVLSVFSSMAFAQTEAPSYHFSCEVNRDYQTEVKRVNVSSIQTSDWAYLGYGIMVRFERIDNSRMVITILRDDKPSTTPTIMDGSRTSQLAMTAGGATLNCFSHREK